MKAGRLKVMVWVASCLLVAGGCQAQQQAEVEAAPEEQEEQEEQEGRAEGEPDGEQERAMRRSMVESQITARGITDERVLESLRKVPRHLLVPQPLRDRAYADSPLPIGYEQTISQPYIVALMSELLEVEPGHKVLEIGTGSGYQAAVLAELGAEVYTIEIICELAERALSDLQQMGYEGVHVRCGDGYKGWPEEAPFDRIIVTAAPPELPQDLVEQLSPGGRLVVPVGEANQSLQVVTKDEEGAIEVEDLLPVRFVPMVPGED